MSSLRVTGGGDVDPYQYLDPPLLDASGLLALGQAILDTAPLSPLPSLLSPLRRLRQACDDLQGLLRQGREAVAAPISLRPESRQPADIALDNAWTALYERLRAFGMLPEAEVPRVKRAHELLRLLYPDALGFLRLPHEAEWVESDKRLRSIEKLGLQSDLDALAGAEFLVEVRRTHELYSRALGRKPEPGPAVEPDRGGKAAGGDRDKDLRDSGESLVIRDQRMHLARCISAYAVKVLALTPDDVKDYQAVKRWLAPLAAYQRAESRRSSQGNGKAAPASSPGHAVPPLPTAAGHEASSTTRMADISSGDHRALSESGSARAVSPSSAGQSGVYRPINESGLFRPVKRPPSSSS